MRAAIFNLGSDKALGPNDFLLVFLGCYQSRDYGIYSGILFKR